MKNPDLPGYLQAARERLSRYFAGSGIPDEHLGFVMSEIEGAHNASYSDGRADKVIEESRARTGELRACNGILRTLINP